MTLVALPARTLERFFARLDPGTVTRAARDAALLVAVLVGLARAAGYIWTSPQDFDAYWFADAGDPYRVSRAGDDGAYLYSPVFVQVLSALRFLGHDAALGLWTAGWLAAMAALAGAWALPLALLLVPDLLAGNIFLFMAAAIVLGFRYPAAWAFILLTKVTPGIALIWFAVRGEWRKLLLAGVATLAISAVSAAFRPDLWAEWVAVLAGNAAAPPAYPGLVPVPLAARLVVAVAVVVWGARSDRAWTVPVAAMLAVPVFWSLALVMLVAVLPLRDDRLWRSRAR